MPRTSTSHIDLCDAATNTTFTLVPPNLRVRSEATKGRREWIVRSGSNLNGRMQSGTLDGTLRLGGTQGASYPVIKDTEHWFRVQIKSLTHANSFAN